MNEPVSSAEFSDIGDISETSRKAVSLAAENAITQGDTRDGVLKFRPSDSCQRQHIAIFLYRMNGQD